MFNEFSNANAFSVCCQTGDMHLGHLIHDIIIVTRCWMTWCFLFVNLDDVGLIFFFFLFDNCKIIKNWFEWGIVETLERIMNIYEFELLRSWECCSNFVYSIKCGSNSSQVCNQVGLDFNDTDQIFKIMPAYNVVMYNAMTPGLLWTETEAMSLGRNTYAVFF